VEAGHTRALGTALAVRISPPPFLAGVTTTAQLAPSTDAAPYFTSGEFDITTGTFTVPETGRYAFMATINYSTTAAISVTLGAGITPSFVIRRTTPLPATDLISGLFPILNVDLPLGVLSLRAILGSGTVTLAGEVELTVGDTIGLFYEADGLTIGLDLGGAATPIVWSAQRIT